MLEWTECRADKNRHGVALDESCIMNLYRPTECVQSSEQECVGNQWANYVYNLTSKLTVAKDKQVTSKLFKIPVFPEKKVYCQCLSVSFNCVRFPFVENFGLNSRKFPVTNGTATVPEFPKKRTTLRDIYSEIFGNYVLGISVPFYFPPAEFLVERFIFQ